MAHNKNTDRQIARSYDIKDETDSRC